MSETQYYYDAFISYRHCEKDQYAAELLHRRLESLRLPREAEKKAAVRGRKKITRIFRDKDELPLTSNLADPIMEALKQSDFLIVICSPRIRESLWCRKEIEAFISLHGRERVLAVLIEGEPEEAFPEEILYECREIEQEDGSLSYERIPKEPLAADIRGDSKYSMRKKLRSEILRLAAPMFGCGYDELKQRHKERRMKRIIASSLAASAVCLTFGSVSMGMALRIDRQSRQIEEQSGQIMAQASEIHEQYIEALRNNSITMADKAFRLLEEGDRTLAAETAAAALPGEENKDIPYTSEAQYALTESLYVYEAGQHILPYHILKHDANVSFMKLSPNGKRLLSVDEFSNIIVWNMESGEEICRLPAAKYANRNTDNTVFLTDTLIAYPSDNGFEVYDVDNRRMKYEKNEEWVYSVIVQPEEGLFAVIGEDELSVYEASVGRLLFEEELPETEGSSVRYSGGCFNTEGTLLAVGEAFSTQDDTRENAVLVYDIHKGEIKHRYAMEFDQFGVMRFYQDILYVINNEDIFNAMQGESHLTPQAAGKLYACDLRTRDSIKWQYENSEGWIHDVRYGKTEGTDYVLAVCYDNIQVLNGTEGTYEDSFHYGTEIASLAATMDSGLFLVFTRDGEYHFLRTDIMTDMVSVGMYKSNSANIKEFLYGSGLYASLPYGESRITIFKRAFGDRMEKAEAPQHDREMKEAEDKAYEEEAESLRIQYGISYSALMACGETLYAAADTDEGTLAVYEKHDGSRKKECVINAGYISYMFFDRTQDNLYVSYKNNTLEVYDVDDLTIIRSYSELEDGIFKIEEAENADFSVLVGTYDSYVINSDRDIIAHLHELADVDFEGRCFYIGSGEDLYRVPFYSLQMLLEECE